MPAFNYRTLLRQIPLDTWRVYFQTRDIAWPERPDAAPRVEAGLDPLQTVVEELPELQHRRIFNELRRVHTLGQRRGIQALLNSVPADSALLEDFVHRTSDPERALWTLIHWPSAFADAEAFVTAEAEIGGRGWKRLSVPPEPFLHVAPEDIAGLRQDLASVFTPRNGRRRACEIDVLTRHLDGAVQLEIRLEDDAQREQEFGPDDMTIWRDRRPPLGMTLILYPVPGVIDLLIPGGERARKKVLGPLGRRIYHKPLRILSHTAPLFLLNRLRDGLTLPADSGLDLLDHGVERMRLSECKVRSRLLPSCDYLIKPPAGKAVPDALDCIQTQQAGVLLGHGFNIIEAVLSLYFFPTAGAKDGRILHLVVRPQGVHRANELDDRDAQLADVLLRALGVIAGSPEPTASAFVLE